MVSIAPEEKIEMVEKVLQVLDSDEVSDERIEAFNEAVVLYRDWLDLKKQL